MTDHPRSDDPHQPPLRLTFGARPDEREERIQTLAAELVRLIRWANRTARYEPEWDWRR